MLENSTFHNLTMDYELVEEFSMVVKQNVK